MLQISWEYDVGMGDGTVHGVSSVIAGETLFLYNEEGGWCVQDGTGTELCYPDIAECRTTTWGMVQAYYHDSAQADGPGREGPLVTSGCSLAILWDYYTKCCLPGP